MKDNILLVDDDQDDIELMQKAFGDRGLNRVHYFTNALETIKHLKGLNTNSLPDIIVTDNNMPSVDGFNLVSFLKHNPIYKSIKVIVITSGLSENERQRLLTAGVVKVLIKPNTIDDYKFIITELIRYIEE